MITTTNRDRLLNEAEGLIRKQPFSREDKARADALIALADHVDDSRDGIRRARLEATLTDGRPAEDAIREAGFASYIRTGFISKSEYRAMGVTVDAAGGYIAPTPFANQLEVALKQYDGLFDVATLLPTKTGKACVFPIMNDASHSAAIVSENSNSNLVDAVLAPLTWGSTPTWRSGQVIAPIELVEDSEFDFEPLLADAFAMRIARGVGASFVTALLSGADSGLTSASTSAVTGDELISLMGSVDPVYGQVGSWCMNNTTYTAILKLKASTGGEYLFPAEVDALGRPLLLGKVVYLSPSMPDLGASAKPITFGDHRQFKRRQVINSLVVKTYKELYAVSGQIAYESFIRVDGVLAKASGSPTPVKYITMHA